MTQKVIKQYKRKLESLTLIPSDGGRFELSVDGELIYSKLQTGQFPNDEEMVEEIGKRLAAV